MAGHVAYALVRAASRLVSMPVSGANNGKHRHECRRGTPRACATSNLKILCN